MDRDSLRAIMTTSFDLSALAPEPTADVYHLVVEGLPAGRFRVESFAGRETLSEPYSFDVVATVESAADEEIERLALGQRASLVWNASQRERAFYGVIASVRLDRVHDAGPRSLLYHLRFVPRLWLLKRRRRTRIFQQMRVPDILDAVLREARQDRLPPNAGGLKWTATIDMGRNVFVKIIEGIGGKSVEIPKFGDLGLGKKKDHSVIALGLAGGNRGKVYTFQKISPLNPYAVILWDVADYDWYHVRDRWR